MGMFDFNQYTSLQSDIHKIAFSFSFLLYYKYGSNLSAMYSNMSQFWKDDSIKDIAKLLIKHRLLYVAIALLEIYYFLFFDEDITIEKIVSAIIDSGLDDEIKTQLKLRNTLYAEIHGVLHSDCISQLERHYKVVQTGGTAKKSMRKKLKARRRSRIRLLKN
ncbi:hypothetical protein EBS02_08505 [bacterium]|nr:hypothetical protein [bacterium]